ncbi:Zonadhesin [Frankliniella fusca]|uniref:Zonadhesin n=1 Tax=Frankliniella fusca TaxID=407009 RepID=A0AAE1HLF6_9NEOP|nr:Zonadhesin [Frankliniella fusca]
MAAVLCEDILVAGPSGHHLLKLYVVVEPASRPHPGAPSLRPRPRPVPRPHPQLLQQPPRPQGPQGPQGHKMRSTALLLIAAVAAICLGDEALKDGPPPALMDDIDPELRKLIAEGGDMGIDMADRDGRSLTTFNRLYRELKKKEQLKTPAVLTPEERRRRARARFEEAKRITKERRERRRKGLPAVQVEFHGDPLSGKIGTARSASTENEGALEKRTNGTDSKQADPQASDKDTRAGGESASPSESTGRIKGVKALSSENETVKKDPTDKSNADASGSNQDSPTKNAVTPSPPISTPSPPSAGSSTLSFLDDRRETVASTTPSAVELSPVGPPPAPVSTASTVFTSSSERALTQDHGPSSDTSPTTLLGESSTAPVVVESASEPSTSPNPGVVRAPVDSSASPASEMVPESAQPAVTSAPAQPSTTPTPAVTNAPAQQYSTTPALAVTKAPAQHSTTPAPAVTNAPAQHSATPAPVVPRVPAPPSSPVPVAPQLLAHPGASPGLPHIPAQPGAFPAPSVVYVPVRPETSPAVLGVPARPTDPAVLAHAGARSASAGNLVPVPQAAGAAGARSWWPSMYASPEDALQAWAAREAAAARERAAQEAVAAQRRAAELMVAEERAAAQEEAAKRQALREAEQTQRRAAELLAAQQLAERQGAELMAARQRALQDAAAARQHAVELAAAQERAAREEAERTAEQQRAAQQALAEQEQAVREAAALLMAEQQRAEREEQAAHQRAAQRAALQEAIAAQQRTAQEAIVAQQIAQQLVDPAVDAREVYATPAAAPESAAPPALGPPNPALSAPRIVDDLPDGDLEQRRLDEFRKWKASLPRPATYLTPLPDGSLPPTPYARPGTAGLPTLEQFEKIMNEARGHDISKRDTTPQESTTLRLPGARAVTTTPAPAPLSPRDPYLTGSSAAPVRHRERNHDHAQPSVPQHSHNPYWPPRPRSAPESSAERRFRPTVAARPFQNATNDDEELPVPDQQTPPASPNLVRPDRALTTPRPERLPTPEPLTVALPAPRPGGAWGRRRRSPRSPQGQHDAQCALFGG